MMNIKQGNVNEKSWLDDTPFIQLTGRFKRNDVFWFTFFHEAGHILLHGKKDVFLENIEYADKINEKDYVPTIKKRI